MSAEITKFVKKYGQSVINATQGTGILPSVTMAQMIIESSGKDENGKFGIGKGIATRKANNFFGIKAEKGYKGAKIALSTPKDAKKVNYFRVYPNAEASIKDHTKFLIDNSRYKKAGVFSAKDSTSQTLALERAGYSEKSGYNKKLDGLIKNFNLNALDSKTAVNTTNKNLIVLGGFLLLVGGFILYTSEQQQNN